MCSFVFYVVGESVPPSNREMITPLLKKSLEKQGRYYVKSVWCENEFYTLGSKFLVKVWNENYGIFLVSLLLI